MAGSKSPEAEQTSEVQARSKTGLLSQELARAVATDLKLPLSGVLAVLRLTQEGATVPFIARYRKEATGALDEVQIRALGQRAEYVSELWERRQVILESIRSQGSLARELESQLLAATTKSELEDLYAPFKPKRRTRASIAKERGLLPLAEQMWNGQAPSDQGKGWPVQAARAFVSAEREVPDVEAALSGARDICAERLSEIASLRRAFRDAVAARGLLVVKKTKAFVDQSTKFDAYAEYSEPLGRVAGHRALAIARGEAEGVLKVGVEIDDEPLARQAQGKVPARPSSAWAEQLREMAREATSRLLLPAAKTDVRGELDERAETAAIAVFATNLRQLLLAAPFGARPVLAIDPGQRTGCKCVALAATGQVLEYTTIYLLSGPGKLAEAERELRRLLQKHRVAAVAVGNGTHGRETERFVREQLSQLTLAEPPCVVSVNEAGASVYSASEVAREEFPELDVTVRGAISIGRRLQDPLAELVKVEPKSIGVGQYQHDVGERRLGGGLDGVVESCVNEVGVELNTASAQLLGYVAGVGKKVARSIVEHRSNRGAFKSRTELRKVAGLGAKTFEQCAGFLRIQGAENPLDGSAVHPERYALVEQMARDVGCNVRSLVGNSAALGKVDLARYASDQVGEPTLKDILAELDKPGRDPRAHFERPKFDDSITQLSDLKPGMQLEGVVTNVTAFGAFVDVGVHQDGLIHVSELADRFVEDPTRVIHVGDKVSVRVLQVDLQRKRIALSRRSIRNLDSEQRGGRG